jgi:N-acetylmuramoyl-L-alanine amidase
MGSIVTWASGTWVSFRRSVGERRARRQDNCRRHRCPSPEQRSATVVLVVALSACPAQPPGATHSSDADDPEGIDLPPVGALVEGRAPLPDQQKATAIAESIERRAEREGAGTRAVALYATAGRLRERMWRAWGREEDVKTAIDSYGAAARDVAVAGACDAAVAGARLVGDARHDPEATYAELYGVERRLGAAEKNGDPARLRVCRQAAEDTLALLGAFRPPPSALAVIDDGLAGQGALLSFLDSSTPLTGAPTHLARVEAWSGREAARVVVVLDRPSAYRIGDEVSLGASDPRTFIDFDGVELGAVPHEIRGEGIVTRIQTEATSTGSRVWLHLDGHAWRRVFELREPYRVVVDVARRPPGVQTGGPRTVARVVIDPGHGGSDSGARGPDGLEEKEVTLDIGLRVTRILEAQGIQVLLTRAEDAFVSLEERTARANAFGADIFVSIHCNASDSRGHRALETYVLDTSRDEIAARVAARENATTQAASGDLASILGGLRLADGARRSRRLAQLLLRASTTAVQARYGDAVDGGVHAAGFYVLVGARMPAVLFETSYISNPTDERRLESAEYRQILADAIANAVRAYREGL